MSFLSESSLKAAKDKKQNYAVILLLLLETAANGWWKTTRTAVKQWFVAHRDSNERKWWKPLYSCVIRYRTAYFRDDSVCVRSSGHKQARTQVWSLSAITVSLRARYDLRCAGTTDAFSFSANVRRQRRHKRLWKCPRKENTTRYCRGEEGGGAEGDEERRKKRTVSTLHSRLVRKRGLKSSGAESSVRARDQDFSEARDRASISARGI